MIVAAGSAASTTAEQNNVNGSSGREVRAKSFQACDWSVATIQVSHCFLKNYSRVNKKCNNFKITTLR